jgi:hypothetical protein
MNKSLRLSNTSKNLARGLISSCSQKHRVQLSSNDVRRIGDCELTGVKPHLLLASPSDPLLSKAFDRLFDPVCWYAKGSGVNPSRSQAFIAALSSTGILTGSGKNAASQYVTMFAALSRPRIRRPHGGTLDDFLVLVAKCNYDLPTFLAFSALSKAHSQG